MAYTCEGRDTVFDVLDEERKMVCKVSVLGSEENGYRVLIYRVEPDKELNFVDHRLQDLDQAIPNTVHFPLSAKVREAISYGLHDIKNGLPIGFTSAQHTEDDRDIDDGDINDGER